jgi:hypothetical protein
MEGGVSIICKARAGCGGERTGRDDLGTGKREETLQTRRERKRQQHVRMVGRVDTIWELKGLGWKWGVGVGVGVEVVAYLHRME